MTLSPKRGNDAAGGSLPRRELSTGLRDGDGNAAGGRAFLEANSWQLEASYIQPLTYSSITGPEGPDPLKA
jgi:hypothetical protein